MFKYEFLGCVSRNIKDCTIQKMRESKYSVLPYQLFCIKGRVPSFTVNDGTRPLIHF